MSFPPLEKALEQISPTGTSSSCSPRSASRQLNRGAQPQVEIEAPVSGPPSSLEEVIDWQDPAEEAARRPRTLPLPKPEAERPLGVM